MNFFFPSENAWNSLNGRHGSRCWVLTTPTAILKNALKLWIEKIKSHCCWGRPHHAIAIQRQTHVGPIHMQRNRPPLDFDQTVLIYSLEWSKNVERWIYSHGLQYERLRFVQSLSPKWRGSLLNCAAHVTNTLPALVPNSLTKDTFP